MGHFTQNNEFHLLLKCIWNLRQEDHILGHKSRLGKFKKIEIIPIIFSDHNAIRLDVSYRRKTIKNSNIWSLNNMLLNNQQITEESKKQSLFIIKITKIKHNFQMLAAKYEK